MCYLNSFFKNSFKTNLKLAFHKASFFIIFIIAHPFAQAKNKLPPLQKLNVKLIVGGDIKGEYDFKGGLGEYLTGSESTGSPCEAKAQFDEVLRLEKRNLQVWIDFKCTQSGQAAGPVSVLKAHRFFVDLKSIEKNGSEKIVLRYFSYQIKNIEILITNLKLSRSQTK